MKRQIVSKTSGNVYVFEDSDNILYLTQKYIESTKEYINKVSIILKDIKDIYFDASGVFLCVVDMNDNISVYLDSNNYNTGKIDFIKIKTIKHTFDTSVATLDYLMEDSDGIFRLMVVCKEKYNISITLKYPVDATDTTMCESTYIEKIDDKQVLGLLEDILTNR